MSPPDPGETALLEALRPAIEVALAHGRDAVAEGGPAGVPNPVRKLLTHARVTTQSLRVVRRALERDDGFRAAVATSAAAAGLDGVAAAWLNRTPGWKAVCDAVVGAARDEALLSEAADARRDAERGRDRAEERLAQAEADLDRAGAEGDRLAARLDAVTAEAASLSAMVDELTVERDRLTKKAARDAHRAQRAEESVGTERARRRALDTEVARLTADLHRAREAIDAADASARAEPGVSAADADELRRAVARAAELLGLLDAARVVTDDTGSSRPPVRRPVRLDRGLVAGSPDGVLALLGVGGMTVLVDGYNVTKAAWPTLSLELQRDRLVVALDALCARTGACCEVVYDGAYVAPGLPRPGRDRVRVSFSPPDVLADDVIVARVAELPAHRPVTVVTSDNEVREGSERLGANLVSSAELIAVLR